MEVSQRQLAELVGCETMLISRYERGTGLPKMDTLIALAQSLQVSLDEVATGQKPGDTREAPIRNVLLLERFRDLETLPRDDQAVALKRPRRVYRGTIRRVRPCPCTAHRLKPWR